MSLPSYDHISKRDVSVVERETYNVTKQAAEASKEVARNSQVTSAELKKLNATTQAIAAANAALVAIQTQALEESNKQTAILDAQLQISKINELENDLPPFAIPLISWKSRLRLI